MLGSVHGLSCWKTLRDAPPAYARRHIENIRTPLMQGGHRGSGLVPWRIAASPLRPIRLVIRMTTHGIIFLELL